MASRETIMTALLALIGTAGSFTTVGRRLVAPENVTVAMSPALFLVEHTDLYKRDVIAAPPKRDLNAMAVIINNVGTDDNIIPATFINNALDNLDAIFSGDNPLVKKTTIGGLVYAAFIEGTVLRGSGDINGLASAFVPIRIILP